MASERDLARLQSALAGAIPGGAAITAVTPLLAGHSNETYVLEGMDAILRLPPAAEPLLKGHGIVAQARIYAALGESPEAPPVPAILHLEESPDLLGDPFFVMGKIRGRAVTDYAIPAWFLEASAGQRRSVCRQWVTAIGKLARLQPLPILGPGVSPKTDALKWRAMAARSNAPDLVALFDRLLERAAPLSGPHAPVHGDCKIANLMWDGFDLSAVLDWELAYNGEPLADLGYLIYFFRPEAYSGDPLPSLAGMIDRAEVVALWEEASGRSAEGWQWSEAAAIGKMAAIIAYGYSLASGGHTFDPRWLRWKDRLDANIEMMDAALR
jgi:aminoglycoside phosphotransferase (APT) family kinase protein